MPVNWLTRIYRVLPMPRVKFYEKWDQALNGLIPLSWKIECIVCMRLKMKTYFGIHARRGGFPFNCVGEVISTLDPSNAQCPSDWSKDNPKILKNHEIVMDGESRRREFAGKAWYSDSLFLVGLGNSSDTCDSIDWVGESLRDSWGKTVQRGTVLQVTEVQKSKEAVVPTIQYPPPTMPWGMSLRLQNYGDSRRKWPNHWRQTNGEIWFFSMLQQWAGRFFLKNEVHLSTEERGIVIVFVCDLIAIFIL